ncbi:hypothetical protein BLNAU_24673 [Blattamonas nauphoetae]|uniref:Uncharacterized protein n=1 Tax=Blattamonas nauphoetae TaxID=2049346 RepID=A0ABQ9WLS1_9EUKA|nr:hypothetical protein BLNAU_24673 [Blattamonas nauphoetae]
MVLYEITALTIAETKTIVEETAKFSIPAEPSRIVGLKNTPNVDGNRTEIVVVGRWMEAGDYTVTLSPSASFTIKFEGTKTEERESNPTTLWLYGSKVDLSFDVSYSLVSVVKATPDAPEIFIDQPIAPFLIAEKTRLTEMRLESYSLDKKKADFVMTGLLLSTSTIYEVELKSASSSRWIAMKLDGSEWKGEAVLYPSADATLKYGDSYSINGFREQGTTVELLHDNLEVIEMIPEPPRLLSCSAEPATGLNTTTLTLTTHALSSGVEYALTLRGSKLDRNDDTSNNEKSDVIISVEGKATIVLPLTLYPLNDADVEYGMNYSIISLSTTGETQPVVIEPIASSFKTPIEPARIETVSAGLNGKKDTTILTMTGRKLHDNQQKVVISRVGSSSTWSAEIFNVSESGCLANFTVGDDETTSSLKFGVTYEIESVGEGVDSFYVNPGRSFFVPLPPRIATLTFASCEITTNRTVLTVEGTSLPNGKTYTATTTSSHTFSIEFSSDTLGTSTILLGWADEMKRKDDEFILWIHLSSRPPLVPSVSAIGCDFDSSTLNNVVLTVTSSGMNGEVFTVQVSEKQDASNILSFSMTFSSASGSKNVAVYKQTGTLEYGKEYELVKVFSSTVNAVIPSPALVLKIPAAPSSEL